MKKIFLAILVLAVLFLAGCNSPPGNSSSTRKSYTGYDSIEMSFVSDSPPTNFYYDQDGFNEIPIVVSVKNKGASDAIGAIFLHGFDPNIVDVNGRSNWDTNSRSGFMLQPSNNGLYYTTPSGYYAGLSGGQSANGNGFFSIRGGGASNTGTRTTSGSGYGNVYTSNGQIKAWSFGLNVNSIGYNAGRYVAQNLLTNPFQNGLGGNDAFIGLQGDTRDMPGGGLEVYEFPAYVFYLPESMENFRQPVMVTACFSYATFASTMMCVDPRPNSNVRKICTPKSVSLSGGQGAPVSITKIEQQSSANKVVFTFNIKHNKKNMYDDIYDYYSLGKCNPNSEFRDVVKATDKNIVYVSYIALSGHPISDFAGSCVPSGGRIRLDEKTGTGEVSCTFLLDSFMGGTDNNAYEAPLEIELSYGYSRSIYRNIYMRRIG